MNIAEIISEHRSADHETAARQYRDILLRCGSEPGDNELVIGLAATLGLTAADVHADECAIGDLRSAERDLLTPEYREKLKADAAKVMTETVDELRAFCKGAIDKIEVPDLATTNGCAYSLIRMQRSTHQEMTGQFATVDGIIRRHGMANVEYSTLITADDERRRRIENLKRENPRVL